MTQSANSVPDMSFNSFDTRFRESFCCENKPDFKELDLGSPNSPLTARSSCTGANGVAGAAALSTGSLTSSGSGSGSGSVSGKTGNGQLNRRSDGKTNNNSGELSILSETSPKWSENPRSMSEMHNSKPRHRRSVSAGAPLIYSGKLFSCAVNGGSTNGANNVSSNPSTNVFASGNICPSGKVLKPGIAHKTANKIDVLGSGTGNYGHGSIMRGGAIMASAVNHVDGLASRNSQSPGEPIFKRAMASHDPEEVKNMGNELYRKGNFVEALSLYDRAISLHPQNAAYRSNRAAALTALGRLNEAARDCEEAVRLDPDYARAHHRLAAIYIRFGHVENARSHLFFSGQQAIQSELQKLKTLEMHLIQCANARKIGDWRVVLRECDAAMAAGADSSPQLIACKAEGFLKLYQLEDANSCLTSILKLETYSPSFPRPKFNGILTEAYVLLVQTQVEMAMGRFENAVSAAEKAWNIDCKNVEVARMLNNVKMATLARSQGKELFSLGRYADACSAYAEGLKYDSSNSVLYCNKAICWSKLGLWEQSIEDSNQALKIRPNYTKALLRRAASNAKLERWVEAVKDYEVLKRELPEDNEVAEALRHAYCAIKNSRGGEVRRILGGEVEEISALPKFKAAISLPGVSVVLFRVGSSDLSEESSIFVNMLCVRHPCIKFFKVDVEKSIAISKAESIRTIPTFKIYKDGKKLMEMIRPTHQFLEESLQNCTL